MSTPRAVLLDATSLPPNKGGVARYLAGLLQGLTDVGERIHVVVKADDHAWLSSQAPDHRYVVAPTWVRHRPARLVWEQVGLPLLGRRVRAEVIHSPHYTFSVAAASRTVVTVHDATFFSAPQDHSALKRLFFSSWIRLGRRLAASSVVPSRATASELAKYTGEARGPVDVALHGVDRNVFHAPDRSAVEAFGRLHDIDTRRGWIAFLGTVEPRKCVPALIEAHARLTAADPDTPTLLIAGGLGWDVEARERLLEAGDVPGRALRYLRYLPLSELPAFLGGSTAVVYPSIGEGFGLPVLEAMSSGAAVLTTDRLALPEVGGDAVAYCDPTAESITTALGDLLRGADRRRRLSEAALARADGFTWGACADVHRRTYSRVSSR